jgi:hypothetical protein
MRLWLAVLWLLVCGGEALGWGPVGHRAVATIAATNLTPLAKGMVVRLLGGETLGDVANWADAVRRTPAYAHTGGYHYEQMSDGESYIESLWRRTPRELQSGGLVAALMVAHLTLRDPRVPDREKAAALKFLVHLAGDVHQPLHTGRPEDRGGSIIMINWFGRRYSLHRVWDSELIIAGHPDLLRPGMNAREAGEAYAQRLIEKYKHVPVNVRMDVRGWMEESVSLRPAAYDPLYQTDPAEYLARNIEVVDRQVFVAGFRLARMLNEIAVRRPTPGSEGELWAQMKEAMGDPRQTIRLNPQPRR